MNKSAKIACGVAGVLVGMGLVMPAVALARQTGVLPVFEICLLIAGLTLTAGGTWLAAHGIMRRRA